MKKLIGALKAIAAYVQEKQPKDFNDACHMLNVVEIIAREAATEVEAEMKEKV